MNKLNFMKVVCGVSLVTVMSLASITSAFAADINHSTTQDNASRGFGFGGDTSNARSEPASGGASGTVDSVSTSSFTMTTSAGQKVTVYEASSTTYKKGTSSTSANAIIKGRKCCHPRIYFSHLNQASPRARSQSGLNLFIILICRRNVDERFLSMHFRKYLQTNCLQILGSLQ
jgi:hypothetical protein